MTMRLWPERALGPSQEESDELRERVLDAATRLDMFVKELRMEVDAVHHHVVRLELESYEGGPMVANKDPLLGTGVPTPETSAEGIARLGRDKVSHHATVEEPLQVSADSLAAEIGGLRTDIASLNKKKGSRLAVIGSYALWAVDIVLIVFMLMQSVRIESSVHEQCSLYQLIIPSYREATRATSPLGPEGYDHAFLQVQTSADNLSCGIPHRVPGT